MECIQVNLGSRSYDITVRPGSLSGIGEWMKGFPIGARALVIADENTGRLFGAAALSSMHSAGFSATLKTVPPGEASKSLVVADQIFEAAIRLGMDRSCAVVALGGGVTGDLAGFVAAAYLRGVPFLQVPTTLLSQVDSSVGGKVAVNHALGKNLIGAFYQPLGVMIDPQTLASLPEREFRSGMAEVIKYGLIADQDFLEELAEDALSIVAREPGQMERIIGRCCRMKASFVERDEQDVGDRILLNFGHTTGHAIEAAGAFERFTHGEGVALGMLVAASISENLGMVQAGTTDKVRSVLSVFGLPTKAKGLRPETLLGFMGTDKKREGGNLRWVLLKALGSAEVKCDVSVKSVRESLQVIL